MQDFIHRGHGILHLVGLRADECLEYGVLVRTGRKAVISVRRISQSTSFADFLEHDTAHTATKVIVVQFNGRHFILIVFHTFHQAGDIDLRRIVMGKEHAAVIVAHVEFVLGRHRLERSRQSMVSRQLLVQAFQAFRTEIHDGVFVVLQILDLSHQDFRVGACNLGRSQFPTQGIVFAIKRVIGQMLQIGSLILLGIVRYFHQILRQESVTHRVGLHGSKQMFKQFQRSIEILVDTRKGHINPFSRSRSAIGSGQLVKLFLQLFGRVFVGSQVRQVIERQFQQLVIVATHFINIIQGEQGVVIVMLVQQVHLVLVFGLLHVLAEIHEYWCNIGRLGSLDILQELAGNIPVDFQRRDLRLVDAGEIGHSFQFVDDRIVIHVLVGEIHYFLLSHFRKTVDSVHHIVPIFMVVERRHHLHGTGIVVTQSLVLAHRIVVDNRLQHFLGEIPFLKPFHLFQHQILHLVQCLALARHTESHQNAIIRQRHVHALGNHHFLLLVQVHIEKTGRTVHQHVGHQIGHSHFRVAGRRQRPAHADVSGILSHNGIQDIVIQRFFFFICEFGEVLGLQLAEILIYQSNRLVRIQIADHDNGHVVRHIVGVEEVLDIDNRRILKLFRVADNGLRAIGMVREQGREHLVPHLAHIAHLVHIVFFVHGFQLSVEQTDYRILETVSLDLGPVFNLVRRNVFHIGRDVVAGESVRPLRTDSGHQLVVFIGNRIGSGNLRNTVNLGIQGLAFGFVRGLAIDFKQVFNLVEVNLLGGIVHRAEVLRAFEHQMFEVVGKTGRFGGVVLASGIDRHDSLDTRSVLVDRKIDFQTVVQRVNPGTHRVARHTFIRILRAAGAQKQGRRQCQQKPETKSCLFHKYEFYFTD